MSEEYQMGVTAMRERALAALETAINAREVKAKADDGVDRMNALAGAQALRDFRDGLKKIEI